VGDLFGTTPDSIPLFWQWLALFFGLVSSILGLTLAVLAFYMVVQTQPQIAIQFIDFEDLEIAIESEAANYKSLAYKLGVRRLPTTVSLAWWGITKEADTAEIGGNRIHDLQLRPGAPLHGLTVAKIVSGTVIFYGIKGPITLEPGSYTCKVYTLEEGRPRDAERKFSVSATDPVTVKWAEAPKEPRRILRYRIRRQK